LKDYTAAFAVGDEVVALLGTKSIHLARPMP
jgi:hypothetical protein